MSAELTEVTDIAIIVRDNPGIVLFDAPKYDEFLKAKKREVESFVPDITTETGRKAIASLAYSVAQEKVKLDKAGKAAKEQALMTCQKIDEARRKIVADFDALRDQARKPLDDWEAANAAREAKAREIIATLNAAAIVPMDATPESVKATLETIRLIDTSEASLQEFSVTATQAGQQAFVSLTTAAARLDKAEAERQELERLRAESEARIAAEQEAARLREEQRLKAEAEELARFAEEARQKAEQARIEQARKEAEEKARQEAERAAREAAEKIEREHAAELARLKEEADKKDREAKAKADRMEAARIAEQKRIDAEREANTRHQLEIIARLEADEAKRKAEEARLKKIDDEKAEADRKLAANKKHRQELMTAAKLALIEHCGITEEQAVSVVRAVVAETIPNVSMRFA